MSLETALGIALRPFFLLLLGVTVLYPVRRAVIKYVKAGRLKSILLSQNKVAFVVIIVLFYVCLIGYVWLTDLT